MSHLLMLWLSMMMDEICLSMISTVMDLVFHTMTAIRENLHIGIVPSQRSTHRCYWKLDSFSQSLIIKNFRKESHICNTVFQIWLERYGIARKKEIYLTNCGNLKCLLSFNQNSYLFPSPKWNFLDICINFPPWCWWL